MSFLRHEEIYRSDVRPGYSWERQLVVAAPALIGCDEFPVGYSLAGCPPAEPASASPTGDDSQQSTLPYNDFSANGNYPLNFLSQSKGALQGAPFPCISNREAPSWSDFCFLSAQKSSAWLCKRMRMKVSAGFLQWEPSRRPSVTSPIAKHVMFEIRISSRGTRFASETNTQMKSGTRW